LTPYRADALTLTTVASGQLSVVRLASDRWQPFTSTYHLKLNSDHTALATDHCLVLFRHRSRHVNDRQQHKDVSLQNRDKNMQRHEWDWEADRNHRKEN
jgi:hypothetical protein